MSGAMAMGRRLRIAAVLGGLALALAAPGASGPAAAANLDGCVNYKAAGSGTFLINRCNVDLTVRYCCTGSRRWGCAGGRAKHKGAHQWMRATPPGRTPKTHTMACDARKGWQWVACSVKDGRFGRALGPYNWNGRYPDPGMTCRNPQTAGTTGQGTARKKQRRGIALTPKCPDTRSRRCWAQVSGRPGCHIWVDGGFRKGTGPCRGGVAHGRWVMRGPGGIASEGPFVNGRMHGRWVVRFSSGTVAEGPYVDGKLHGQWAVRHSNGSRSVCRWRHGKKLGCRASGNASAKRRGAVSDGCPRGYGAICIVMRISDTKNDSLLRRNGLIRFPKNRRWTSSRACQKSWWRFCKRRG